MTVFAFVFGAFVGFFGGLIGWLFLDMSFLSAVAIYFVTTIGFGLLAMIRLSAKSSERNETPACVSAQPAHR